MVNVNNWNERINATNNWARLKENFNRGENISLRKIT